MSFHLLGQITVIFGCILFLLLIAVIVKCQFRKVFDVQTTILIIAAGLMQPLFQAENLIYLSATSSIADIMIPYPYMMMVFLLGLIGFFIYHLYLLSIEDFPLLPVASVLLLGGFAIASFILSINVDYSNPLHPIQYDPVRGGMMFLLSMTIFSFIGIGGFLRSLLLKPFPEIINRIVIFDLVGLILIALTPATLYISRMIEKDADLPFNWVFLPAILGLCLHFGTYLFRSDLAGYPLHANLTNLMIMDKTTQTVLSGFTVENIDESKLHGMAMLAVDNLMSQILGMKQTNTKYLGNYGNILFIQDQNYILIASFDGLGKKIGQFVLSKLLAAFIISEIEDVSVDFKKLVNQYIHIFLHKKVTSTTGKFFSQIISD